MNVPGFDNLELVYCLNIHPGETWTEQMAAVQREAGEVRGRVADGRSFGLGLRISARAARELTPAARAAAAATFRELGMHAVTVNAFPFGTFHRARVKEQVYAPDWRTDARLAYTLRVARILAGWLPDGADGSVSTVPGSYGPWIRGDRGMDAIVRRLVALAASLDELRRRGGRDIHVALEPEPDCLIETARGFIEWFDGVLLPRGIRALRGLRGMSSRRAEAVVRRHIGICVDTCHLAVGGERPSEALLRLRRSGVRVSKIQISAAPAAPTTAAGLRALRAFADPVYLHQTRRWVGALEADRWPDLPEALAALRGLRGGVVRTHCHIPLFHRPRPPLRSTAEFLDADFWAEAVRATRVLEIETYTFHALPRSARPNSVVDSIVAEYRWCLRRLATAARQGAGF